MTSTEVIDHTGTAFCLELVQLHGLSRFARLGAYMTRDVLAAAGPVVFTLGAAKRLQEVLRESPWSGRAQERSDLDQSKATGVAA